MAIENVRYLALRLEPSSFGCIPACRSTRLTPLMPLTPLTPQAFEVAGTRRTTPFAAAADKAAAADEEGDDNDVDGSLGSFTCLRIDGSVPTPVRYGMIPRYNSGSYGVVRHSTNVKPRECSRNVPWWSCPPPPPDLLRSASRVWCSTCSETVLVLNSSSSSSDTVTNTCVHPMVSISASRCRFRGFQMCFTTFSSAV